MDPEKSQPGLSSSLDGLHKAVLDAIPHPIFVVDYEVRVKDCNRAGLEMVGALPEGIFGRRGGEVLGCVHAASAPGGCGTAPDCGACNIRNSIKQAFEGHAPRRIKHHLQIAVGESRTEADLLVTTAPIRYGGRQLALLVLEDVTELAALRRIVPICAYCRKVRDDGEYWQNVESYCRSRLAVDFSHGICPDCMGQNHPEFAAGI